MVSWGSDGESPLVMDMSILHSEKTEKDWNLLEACRKIPSPVILSGKVSVNINETKYMMMEGVPGIYYAGQANSCWGQIWDQGKPGKHLKC